MTDPTRRPPASSGAQLAIASTTDGPTADGSPSAGSSWLGVLVGVAVVAPVVMAGVGVFGQPWFPAGDWAMTELRVLDTARGRPALLGPYSRFGWNHPGPLLFWVLAPLSRATGHASWSLLVGAALVNASALAATSWLLWRRLGGLTATVAAVALALLVASLGPESVTDPWNPWVSVLPFAVFVVAIWATVEHDRVAPVLAVVSGSFVAQSHLGYLPLVGVLGLVGVVGWLAAAGRPIDRRGLRPLLVASVVGVVCWSPVVAHTLMGGGNVGLLVDHAAASDEPVGFGAAVGIASRQLAPIGPWSGFDEPIAVDGGGVVPAGVGGLAVASVALGGAAILAHRRGETSLVRLQGVLAVAALTGVVVTARISGEPYNHLLRWWWVLAALWWATVAASLVRALPRPRRPAHLDRVVGAAAAAVVVVLGSASMVGSPPVPEAGWSSTVAHLAQQGLPALAGEERVVLERRGPHAGWIKDAMAPRLEEAGVGVLVVDRAINRPKFGDDRVVAEPPSGVAVLWVVTGADIAAFAEDPRYRPVAHDRAARPRAALFLEDGSR